MSDLFQRGDSRLHSGELSRFKIDCDALSVPAKTRRRGDRPRQSFFAGDL